MSCLRAQIKRSRHSNTVLTLVRLFMWLLKTNKSTILRCDVKRFIQTLCNTVLLLVRLTMSLLRTNKSTILLCHETYIWLRSHSSLVILEIFRDFSYIGVRHHFWQADFFMPELLLKELYIRVGQFFFLSCDTRGLLKNCEMG